MDRPGDRRPEDAANPDPPATAGAGPSVAMPRTLGGATFVALLIGLLAATAWALLRGILDLGPGLLAISALAGWAIGATLRIASGPRRMAIAIAGGAWALGLIGTWLVSMAILHGSTRTFSERLEATPFIDWMRPQVGWLEIAGLLLYVIAAAYGARRIRSALAPPG